MSPNRQGPSLYITALTLLISPRVSIDKLERKYRAHFNSLNITKKSLAVISSCCLKSFPCMSIMDVLLLARIWWFLEILGTKWVMRSSRIWNIAQFRNVYMPNCNNWLLVGYLSNKLYFSSFDDNFQHRSRKQKSLETLQIWAKLRDKQVWWSKTHGLFEVLPNIISANYPSWY